MDFNEYALKYEYEEIKRQMQASVFETAENKVQPKKKAKKRAWINLLFAKK